MRAWFLAGALLACGAANAQPVGIFDGQSDVGAVSPPGTATLQKNGDYLIASAGANIWARVDGFHYLWKKMSGDAVLTADVSFLPGNYGHAPAEHRKGVLMVRQSLEPGSAQASVHVHGIGMTAIQHRDMRGANTQSIELNIPLPRTVRLEKRGDTFTLLVSNKGEALHPVGASFNLHLDGPFYIGLGATSHDAATTDRVLFKNVKLEAPAPAPPAANLVLTSSLKVIQVEDEARRAGGDRHRAWADFVARLDGRPEGGLFLQGRPDMKTALLDPLNGGTAEAVDTAGLVDCAGDYGVAPDGKAIALSCAEAKGGTRNLYVLAFSKEVGVGKPKQLTTGVNSFFHGWSADGSTLLFTRGKAAAADFWTIGAAGGPEKRMTGDTLSDGPEFTPDGKTIYFDSSRSGSSQIWKMNADGTGAVQVTDDGMEDQSPHVSPDGATVVWLQKTPGDTAAVQDVSIQLLSVKDGAQRTLVRFQGNRNSFSMPVWGDRNHLVFVSYQMLPAANNGATQ